MISKYIMDCLSCHKMIVWSWGFNSPVSLPNGLQFKVQGFVFKGIVQIKYNDGKDLFDIKLINNDEIIKVIRDVYVDDLVFILDRHIEKDGSDEKYRSSVENEYSLI